MPLFRYTAMSQDGKEMNGEIEAISIESAHTELNRIGLSILNIHISTPEEEANKKNQKLFEFIAVDKNNKHITGTASGENLLTVYKKLKEEYKMSLSALYDANLPSEEKAILQSKGVASIEAELDKVTKGKTSWWKKTKSDKDSVNKKAEKESEEENRAHERVEKTVERTKSALANFNEKISNDDKKKINDKLATLLRLKLSANAINLEKMCDEIIETIQDIEATIKEQAKIGEKGQVIAKTKRHLFNLEMSQKTKVILFDLTQESYTELFNQIKKNFLKFLRNPKIETSKEIYLPICAIGEKLFNPPQKTAEDEQINKFKNDLTTCRHQIWLKMQIMISPEEETKIRNELFYQIKRILAGSKIQKQEATEESKKLIKIYKDLLKKSSTRKEALTEFKALLHQYKLLTASLHELKMKRNEGLIELHASKIYQRELFWLEANRLFGWLLIFYLGYYLLSGLNVFGAESTWQKFLDKTHSSSVLHNIIAGLFFSYTLFTIKLHILKKPKLITNLTLIFIGIIGCLIVLVNF